MKKGKRAQSEDLSEEIVNYKILSDKKQSEINNLKFQIVDMRYNAKKDEENLSQIHLKETIQLRKQLTDKYEGEIEKLNFEKKNCANLTQK